MGDKDTLVEIICIDICDGENGRCQRYPRLSRSCDRFYPLEKAYKAGICDVVEWIEGYNINAKGYSEYPLEIPGEDWQAKLKSWNIKEK